MTVTALDTFVRHFRIAEWPYDDPSSEAPVADRYLAAMAAENRLRDKLLLGILPAEIVLVAPERGCIAAIDDRGRLEAPACAWLASSRHGPESPFFMASYLGGGIHVVADIESDSFIADPASEEWAAAGSFALGAGRVTRLNVPAWLRPVAGMLVDTYGVPVAVHGEFEAFEFVESEPLVINGALLPEEVALLQAYLPGGHLAAEGVNKVDRRIRLEYRVGVEDGFRLDGNIDMTRPPRELAHEVVMPLLEQVADLFEVPANRFIAQLMTYRPGAQKIWHLDRNPEIEPASWSRTVALSVLLGQSGRDFTGGELETPRGIVDDLSLGDAVAFTSVTPHRVRPIRAGSRSALVVLGSWDGWS